MIRLIIIHAMLLFSTLLKAQDLTELSESVAYFDDGINFEHKKTQFKTRFRFRMQNRFTYETKEAEKLSAKTVDFTVRRFRLRLDGHVLDQRLLYRVQLSFTRGDLDYDRTEYPNILRDAVVGWKLTDHTTLWYGQTKLPGNRQRLISSGAQEFVDRSLLTTIFNIDRDLGTQLHHRIGESKPLWVKLAISNGEGRSTDNKDSGLSYTSRVEWLPLGVFKNEGDYFEGDLEREPDPKLSFGASYNFNKKTTRPGGQLGRQFTTPGLNRDLETWFADALLKYRGFSWSGEYARRWTHDPVFTDNSETVAVYKGQGFNTQISYVNEYNIQPAIRYTKLWAATDTLAKENDRNQYTMAVSKYFNNHTVKVQSDITYDEQKNRVLNTYANSWIYRLQLEIGI